MKKYLLSSFLALNLFANDYFIELHLSPSCGCCESWADYMQKKGYEIKFIKTRDFYKIKDKYHIKPQYQSCHTGIIQGYVIEGHVPQSAIKWLLENKPKNVIGISAPGMPLGSPGMEQGDNTEEYPIILLFKDGSHRLYGYFKGDELTQKGL